MKHWTAHPWISLIEASASWAQPARTRLAHFFGDALWWAVASRRRIALINLRLCFPQLTERQRRRIGRQAVRNLARAMLDHGVLTKAPRDKVEEYVQVNGIEHLTDAAAAKQPLILIAPHFVGLDAGGIRISAAVRGIAIYSKQKNAVWDQWLLRARQRFRGALLMPRQQADLRILIRELKAGRPLYYLPDADLGPINSIFVPFFGVSAATIPMVSRLARITGAKVLMAVTEMTADGYVMHFEPPWTDFPGASIEEDTARMNREIERWVERLPDQYLWTHKRFKTRPPGEAGLYR